MHQKIKTFFGLTDFQLASLSPYIETISLRPKECFDNSQSFSACFINKGIVKEYFHQNDTIIINNFYCENDLIIDFNGFPIHNLVLYSLQAIEESELYIVKNSEILFRIYTNSASVRKIVKENLQQTLFNAHFHLQLLQVKDPMERYKLFLKERNELVNRVSVRDLSSYLGVTRETLSRLRQRLLHF
jgi:CRP-like cAMP-binding protein